MDKRWRLTLPDSMVHGHYSVLVDYAAKRFVSDEQRREWRKEAQERGGQVIELKQIVASQRSQIKMKDDIIDQVTEDNFRLGTELQQANNRLHKLRPWATIGKVGVVVVSVGAIGLVTAKVLEGAK